MTNPSAAQVNTTLRELTESLTEDDLRESLFAANRTLLPALQADTAEYIPAIIPTFRDYLDAYNSIATATGNAEAFEDILPTITIVGRYMNAVNS